MKTNLFDLSDQVVVLTGATGFLGQVFAKALADHGGHVVIADIESTKCQTLANEINAESPGRASAFAVDLANEKSVEAWAADILQAHKKVDVLINNAATKSLNFFADLERFSLEDWNQVMAVNVTGIFLAVRALAPHMVKNKRGNIINMSSIYGVVAPDQSIYEGSYHADFKKPINTPLIYSTTKSAVIGMTQYLATYYGDKGIRTNTLTPGGIFGGQNDEFLKRYSAKVPMRRMGQREELIGALLFLASPASSYVNGQNIVVDGGFTVW